MTDATPWQLLERRLGRVDYLPTYERMQAFTAERGADTPDQLWICEHSSVYTQGLTGDSSHILVDPGHIPVVPTNRGGQVTYHGPGQVVAYPLIDLKRAGYFVKEYVFRLEEAVLRSLTALGVTGHRVRGAPGIYVRTDDPHSHARLPDGFDDAQLGKAPNLGKIAALGIKVSRHCTYHGLSFNVAMDLTPFERINPCGYAGLRTVDLSTIGVHIGWEEAATLLASKLRGTLAP